jgi:hypothetical protein
MRLTDRRPSRNAKTHVECLHEEVHMRRPRNAVLLSLLAVAPVAAVPAGASPSDDRVRPGLGYTSDLGGCTFGFLLAGSDGRSYAATAGHCAVKDGVERVWLRGDGPVVTNDQARPVGHFVYAVKDNSARVDFALIRLNEGIKGNPQLCAWGGPTRLLTEPREGLTELRQHGQGILISEVAPTRTAVARSLPREPYTFVQGPF